VSVQPGNVKESAAPAEYRLHTGDPGLFDVRSALQFNLLTSLGLRDEHYLLDIGCGSLSAGRLFIPYLRPGRYFGIEPLEWLVEKGIAEELGPSAVDLKKPTFLHDDTFTLSAFGRTFDFLIAQSIFSHTSQAQLRRCLSEAAKVMTPSSIFAATFFEGSSNYEGDTWTAHADYTMDKLSSLVEEQGLILRPIEWDHQDLQRWVLILHGQTTVKAGVADTTVHAMHLERELERAREQLLSIRSHPWMKLGYKIKFFLITAQFTARRVRRALTGR
jgi:hypothetical protein